MGEVGVFCSASYLARFFKAWASFFNDLVGWGPVSLLGRFAVGVWLVWGLVSLLSGLMEAFLFVRAAANIWVALGVIRLLNSSSSDVVIVLRWACMAIIRGLISRSNWARSAGVIA